MGGTGYNQIGTPINDPAFASTDKRDEELELIDIQKDNSEATNTPMH